MSASPAGVSSSSRIHRARHDGPLEGHANLVAIAADAQRAAARAERGIITVQQTVVLQPARRMDAGVEPRHGRAGGVDAVERQLDFSFYHGGEVRVMVALAACGRRASIDGPGAPIPCAP